MNRKHVFAPQLVGSLLFAAMAVTGCTIQSKHEAVGHDGHDENVKIETPLGNIDVRTDKVDAKDTGMSVFPGATIAEKEDSGHNDKKANVNINTPWFGVKVVALTFQSPEAQEKIWEYYKKELNKYGRVLECRPGSADLDIKKKNDEDLTCSDDDKTVRVNTDRASKSMKLKVGTSNKQRIVALKPSGSGTEFSLVYVFARGEKEML